MTKFKKDLQFYKFCAYGFLKNLRFFEPFLILYLRGNGLSFLAIGTLFSIREISINLFEIPTGIVADAYGRRKSMIFSFISYIISFIIFYFSKEFWILAIAFILFAFGDAFRTGTHKAMILQYLKIKNMTEHKVEYYGHTRGCSQLGSAISSLIAAVIVYFFASYRIVFLATIIPYIFELGLMISYPKELDGEKFITDKTYFFASIWDKIKHTTIDFINIFKDKNVLKVMLNSSVFDAAFKSSKDYLQPILKMYIIAIPLFLYLNQEKRIAILTGIVYSILYFLTSTASRNSSKFSSLFKDLKSGMIHTYLFLTGILLSIGIFAFFKLYIVVIILFIVMYVLFNMRRPITVGLISEMISSRIMAAGLSGESQLKTIFVAIFSPLIGYLIDLTGIGIAFILFALIILAIFSIIKL